MNLYEITAALPTRNIEFVATVYAESEGQAMEVAQSQLEEYVVDFLRMDRAELAQDFWAGAAITTKLLSGPRILRFSYDRIRDKEPFHVR